MMTPELFNRIEDELRDYLKRSPSIGEVINSQNDHLIMMRVNDRINTEEKGKMQDQIDDLELQLTDVKKSVGTVIIKSVG